jgi:hypothetical protein
MNYERKNETRTRKKSKNIEKHFKKQPTSKLRKKKKVKTMEIFEKQIYKLN